MTRSFSLFHHAPHIQQLLPSATIMSLLPLFVANQPLHPIYYPPPITFESRLNHLAQSGAFSDCVFSRQPRHGIKRMLHRWNSATSDIQSILSPCSYYELKEARRTRQLGICDPDLVPSFTHIPSTIVDEHHQLVDKNNIVLAYRFRYPTKFLHCLEESQTLLPQQASSASVRGTFAKRHYALWADYSPDIFESREYRRDFRHSTQWLASNKPLFDYLSDNLRMINPEMYKKFTSIDRFLEGSLRRMAGAWHGVAINQSMAVGNSVSKTHIDWQDCVSGFNAVIPWGDFGGGHLILWPAKVVYQIEPGECLFFRGGIMAHQVQPVTSGIRNSLDLFCHKSAFDWHKRQLKASGIPDFGA